MNDEQQNKFEDQARCVGRKKLPPEWRTEILDAALRGSEEHGATWENVVEIVNPNAIDAQTWERRIRKAERRAIWSMAACFVLTVVLAALLFRPEPESSRPQLLREASSVRNLRAHDWRDSGEAGADDAKGAAVPSFTASPATPPPPPSVEIADGVHPIEESTGGFLSGGSAVHDTFALPVSGVAKNESSAKGREALAQLSKTIRESNESLTGPLSDLESNVPAIQNGGGIVHSHLKAANQDLSELQHGLNSHRGSVRPMTPDAPALSPPNSTSEVAVLGQHSDRASWDDVSITGGVFASKADTEGKVSLDRLAARRGTSLDSSSAVGDVSGRIPGGKASRDDHGIRLLSGLQDDSRSLLTDADRKSREQDLLGAVLSTTPNKATGSMNGRNGTLAEGELAAGESQVWKRSTRKRRPFVIQRAEASNNVTEEVRYQVDARDPVVDPQTAREIGVTVAMTPTLLPDGTVRMKMRPRSAEVVEEVIGQSGDRYTEVSESMLEKVASIPPGHSLVVGGFYGEVKNKDDNKVPILGDIPRISLFLKNEEAAQEESSLLFVVSPTTDKSKDQVVIDTKVLKVNDSVAARRFVDWQAGLGTTGVAAGEIRELNSLLGIESAETRTGPPAASDGSLVLSSEQTNGVLRALARGGLVKQISNPTLITEDNELATISLIDRVPIITTTVNQTASPEPVPVVPEPLPEEPEKDAKEEPWSTFSLNVSDVSFKLAKAALARGEWPAPGQIRVEEFVNAFDYGDPSPRQEEKVACHLEQAAHPFMQQRNLLRVSMKTAALGRAASTPLRLTVLLDNSGSMERTDRVASVKNAFQLLAAQLNPEDQVTLIGFARTPRLLADRVAGNRVAELVQVVDSTPSSGGTNIEEALKLGFEKAKEQMVEGAQNRIILLTDGAVNLGNAQPHHLATLVEQMRRNGISFDACGVGADGLNDEVLEALTRKGDGRYYFLDRPEDADDGFARQIAGALRPAARNVKVQVKFNPDRVGRYKLYGFNKHRLKKEDFRDDSVDAAELAAAEAGNAVYQFEPLPEGTGEIGTVSVRFQDTESGRMIEREWIIPYVARIQSLEDSPSSLRLASGAALLAEKLKGSPIGESVEMAGLGKLVNGLPGDFPDDLRVSVLTAMMNKARELSGE